MIKEDNWVIKETLFNTLIRGHSPFTDFKIGWKAGSSFIGYTKRTGREH